MFGRQWAEFFADPEVVQIRYFEPPGIQLGERMRKEIEKHFSRLELRRASAAEVGTVSYPARVRESYAQGLLDSIDVERVRERHFRLVVDYGYSAASYILPLLLGLVAVKLPLRPQERFQIVAGDDYHRCRCRP